MANKKITDLTELTTLSPSDLVEVVDDPSGTPASYKMTQLNLVKAALGLTASDEFETRAILHEETLASPGNFDVSSISQSYTHLKIRAHLRSSVSAIDDTAYLFFNNDTTVTNYYREYSAVTNGTDGDGQSNAPGFGVDGANSPASSFARVIMDILGYSDSNIKIAIIQMGRNRSAGALEMAKFIIQWSTSAINRITIQPDGYATDNFVTGSYLQIIGIGSSG